MPILERKADVSVRRDSAGLAPLLRTRFDVPGDPLWLEIHVAVGAGVSAVALLDEDVDDSRRRRCRCSSIVCALFQTVDDLSEVCGRGLDLCTLVDQHSPCVSVRCLSSPVSDASYLEVVGDRILPSFVDAGVERSLRVGVEREHHLFDQGGTSIGVVHAIDMPEPPKSVPSHDVAKRRLTRELKKLIIRHSVSEIYANDRT